MTTSTDILNNFVLRSDLSFAENIVLNYAIVTGDKAKAIGSSMNFLARSAAQKAFASLKNKYKIIHVDEFGAIKIRYEFKRDMTDIKLNNRIGRPAKLINHDTTHG